MTRNFSRNASGKPIYFLYDPNGKQSNFHVMQVVGQLNFFFFFFCIIQVANMGAAIVIPVASKWLLM